MHALNYFPFAEITGNNSSTRKYDYVSDWSLVPTPSYKPRQKNKAPEHKLDTHSYPHAF